MMPWIVGFVEYFWYLFKHKWWVGYFCIQEGMYWRALKHDWTKFYWTEFVPYIRHFHVNPPPLNIYKTSYHKSLDNQDKEFNRAYRLHVRRNSHHWEYYLDINGVPEPMDLLDAKEMLCDWRGAARTKGNPWSIEGTRVWYNQYKHKIILHPDTRIFIEQFLGIRGNYKQEVNKK